MDLEPDFVEISFTYEEFECLKSYLELDDGFFKHADTLTQVETIQEKFNDSNNHIYFEDKFNNRTLENRVALLEKKVDVLLD